jgi:hypothetical protein
MRLLAWSLALALPCIAAGVETIPWEAADKHVGKDVTVEGRVVGIHCSPTSCLLAFEPSFNRFTAVIQARSFKTFPPDTLNETFVGRVVRVHGTVRMLESKPEIEVEAPDDLQLVVTDADRADEAAAARDATEDLLSRVESALDRLEQLATRLDAAQARLEQLAQALDERAEQLAVLEQGPTMSDTGPPPPSYGEPQPRSSREALRHVKRGMTSDEVARLIGRPLEIEAGAGGAVTWYYGYGRSITFDRRGRATSLVGIPTP